MMTTITQDVNVLILLASGYGNKAYTQSDIREIYREVRRQYGSNTRVEIFYGVWDGKWKDTARRYDQVLKPGGECVFIGHSYGCGHAYKVFAKEWEKLGREIAAAILIDPVIRIFKLAVFMNWISLTRWFKFKAVNTKQVFAFRQVNSSPYGRFVVGGGASIARWVFGSAETMKAHSYGTEERHHDPTMNHEDIDGSPYVQRIIYEKLAGWLPSWLES
jgi:pimeloyl-ACP methyl ester carboxylesterase